ncbi:hypothetical protein XELAEV_18036383mg [Xenopus laevis]|uniref:Transmembrane protein 82 n=1 Tax=Xenopus laevis TaxID=8355 RepID=A0A974CJL1_XENLA|nr:hypothetical protein XELAEV_18036383mg [Xenopus laevis]
MGFISYFSSFLPDIPWHFWGSVDSLLQVAMGEERSLRCSDPDKQKEAAQLRAQSLLMDFLHVSLLTLIYSLLGPRVGALVVLEFSLRAVSMVLSVKEQQQNPSDQMMYQTVFVRMGGLLILMMTVGRWADILHIFISLTGEIWCLIHAGVMLRICREQDIADRISSPRKAPISRGSKYTRDGRTLQRETSLEE